MEDGKVVFQAESDALIVKGIIALLIKVVSGHTPDEILSSDLYFIETVSYTHLDVYKRQAGMVPARSGENGPSPFKALLTSITRPLQWAPTDMPPPRCTR